MLTKPADFSANISGTLRILQLSERLDGFVERAFRL